MKAKSSVYTVSLFIQKAFIALAFVAYVVQVSSLWQIFHNVYSGGWRVSQFVWMILSVTILPLVLFVIAYFSTRHKSPLLWRVFESSFFVIIGLLLQTIMVQFMLAVVDTMMNTTKLWFGNPIIWYEVVPLLLTLIAYVLVIIWNRRPKLNTAGFSLPLQRTYILLFSGAVAALAGITAYHMILQYPFNSNFSSYLLSVVQMIVLPAVLFATAFITSPEKLSRLTRVFDGLLFTTMGMLLYTVVGGIVKYFDSYFISSGAGYWPWTIYGLGVIALTLIVYIMGVRYLRYNQKNPKTL